MITKYINQFFHQSAEPLDASLEVETTSDLGDTSKVVPYIGKIVHVKDARKFYVCSSLENGAVWRPVINDSGTEIYLTAGDGKLLTIRAVQEEGGDNLYRLEATWDGGSTAV